MTKKYFLGVDGGATKTAAAIMDTNGKIVSKVVGGGSNYRALGENVAKRNLHRTIFKVAKKFRNKIKYSCFGMASVDTKKDKKNVYNFIVKCGIKKFLGCPILVVNDVEIILPSVTDRKLGIAVIGGTGTNFYGINGNKRVRTSGLDYILADEGSSYDIGLKVLKAATRSYDGRGKKTILEKMVFKAAKVNDIYSLKDAVHEGLKSEIAMFAPLASKAAKEGDKVAKQILSGATKEYVIGIKTIMKKTNLRNNFDIAFTGKLFTQKVLLGKVVNDIRKISNNVKFHIVEDSVVGAAKLAIRASKLKL